MVDDLAVIFADIWSVSFHNTFAIYFLRHCLNHGQIMATGQYISSGSFFGRAFPMDCSWGRTNSRTQAVTLKVPSAERSVSTKEGRNNWTAIRDYVRTEFVIDIGQLLQSSGCNRQGLLLWLEWGRLYVRLQLHNKIQ